MSDGAPAGTSCGSMTCNADEYCLITQAAESCRAFPSGCAPNPSCLCLINENLCPGTMNKSCSCPKPGEGIVVRCPVPDGG
jgi:hypothetical protein